MARATGQFTIVDLTDITISATEPVIKVPDMLWLDSSTVPNQLKSWNGVTWVYVGDRNEDAISDAKDYTDSQISPIQQTITTQGTQISAIQGQITNKVWQTDVDTAVNGLETSMNTQIGEINTTVDNITARVSQTEIDTSDLEARIDTAEGELDIQAGEIALRVRKDGIIGDLNLSPEETRINSNRLVIGTGTNFQKGEKYTWEQYVGAPWWVLADIVVDPYMLWDEMTGNIYVWRMVVSNGVPSIYLTLDGTAEDGNKYVIQDDVTGITYKWSMTLSNGLPSIYLTEVPAETPDSPIENEYVVVDNITGVTYEWNFNLSNQVIKIQLTEVI